MRELISAGKLRYPVAQKDDHGNLVTKTIEKEGPVTFMVTTTRAKLHHENETRMLSIEVDDSEAQTRAVMRKVAETVGLNLSSTADLQPWWDFQRLLAEGPRDVVIPYAKVLSDLVPSAAVRLRRLSKMLQRCKRFRGVNGERARTRRKRSSLR